MENVGGITHLQSKKMCYNRIWIITVSYTHLDVYKRQALTAVAVIGIVGVSAAEIRYLMQLSREAQDMGDLRDCNADVL